jgi:hypothetical protein
MEIPEDVLSQIKEFSRPVTRPDWRNFKPMPINLFIREIAMAFNDYILPVLDMFIANHKKYKVFYKYTFRRGLITGYKYKNPYYVKEMSPLYMTELDDHRYLFKN